MKVLFSVPQEKRTANPYITLLERSLVQQGTCVERFSWRSLLFADYDVFHMHWPEFLVRGANPIATGIKALLLSLASLRWKHNRTVIVRTVHNAQPHEHLSRFQNMIYSFLEHRVDGRVFISRSSMSGDLPAGSILVPHGRYTEWFGPAVPVRPAQSDAPLKVLFFGALRPYKGVEKLMEALPPGETRISLRIVGNPMTTEYKQQLLEIASGRSSISLQLGFIDDPDLWHELSECEIVVLPYVKVTNSGSLLLALSAGRPVLMTDSEIGREAQDEFGTDWVQLFSGHISADALVEAASRARDLLASGSEPDLSHRTWADAGREHLRFYKDLLGFNSSKGSRF